MARRQRSAEGELEAWTEVPVGVWTVGEGESTRSARLVDMAGKAEPIEDRPKGSGQAAAAAEELLRQGLAGWMLALEAGAAREKETHWSAACLGAGSGRLRERSAYADSMNENAETTDFV